MSWIDDAGADARYAIRQMQRAPGFTAIAIATLALGIGANTAIFTVINAVILKPLPYRDSGRLVYIVSRAPATGSAASRDGVDALAPLDPAQFVAFRARTRTLSHVAGLGLTTETLTGQGDPVPLDGAQVSPDTFEMLGVAPAAGRSFTAAEESRGADAVVILSHGLWTSQFGANPNVLGRAITLNGRERTVVGIMPGRFAFPDPQTAFWIPYVTGSPDPGRPPRVPVVARLEDGATLEAASIEVNALLGALGAGGVRPPPGNAGGPAQAPATPGFRLVGIEDRLIAPVRPGLVVLMVTVGLVLLMACVNVANLLLARSAAREQEMAMRLALGASRGRLFRQLLTESLTLAVTGGLVGVVLAAGGVHLLQVLGTSLARRDLDVSFSLPRLDEGGLDRVALAFNVGVSGLTGILFGIVPALRHSRDATAGVVRPSGGGAAPGFSLWRRNRPQALLVSAEIAMAVVLLVSGVLLMRSFVKLARVNPGYQSANVLTFQIGMPAGRPVLAVADALVERLRSVSGVREAGYTRQLPMTRARSLVPLRTTPELPTQPAPPPAPPGTVNPPEWPDARHVSAGYLGAMRMRVIEGRGFEAADAAGQQVMLINRTLARSGLLGPNPVGRYVYALGIAPWEIVGVVDDVRQSGLDHEPGPQVFINLKQLPGAGRLTGSLYLTVRTDGNPSRIAPIVGGLVQQLEPAASVSGIATMDQLVANSVARPRLYAVLVGIFAAIAVVLSCVGIYGVVGCAVAQRTHEIGVRIALGARRSHVMRLILGDSAAAIGIGVALGLVSAVGVTRYLTGLLFGLTPLDLATFAAVPLAVVAVALLASYVPVRRAARIDPLMAIRHQ
jgi:putative ABC transport system permease protein